MGRKKYMGRPEFPKRAVITGGMPYGNKTLHFGHVGGMYVHADVFARFLRDRIGKENVIFVSGTDCYGSPIAEGYRKKVELEGYKGTIEDYVRENHDAQEKTLRDYMISLDLFGASGLDDTKDVHQIETNEFIRGLYGSTAWSQSSSTIPNTSAFSTDVRSSASVRSKTVSRRRAMPMNAIWAISTCRKS